MPDNRMKKIRFIANPHSGVRHNRDLRGLIEANLNHEMYEYELYFTEYAGHAIKLAEEGVKDGCYMVAACGGDGSVNEIAGRIIGSEAVLGILPCGSGNGFATHLGISRNIGKAIRVLNEGKVVLMDSALMDDKPFVNLAGIGFDAEVARLLHRKKVRGIVGYLTSTLKEIYRYQMQSFEIQIDGKKLKRTCLLVEVANAPIYGYGFSIVPPANPNDGRLELLIANEASKLRYLFESWRFLNRSFHKSSLVESYSGTEILITPEKPTAVHIDGEGYKLPGSAKFSIRPRSIRVLCPGTYADNLHHSPREAVSS